MLDDLSDEQRQGLEVIRRKHREEFEALKKKCEEEDLQEYIKSLPPCSKHAESSTLSIRDDGVL